MATSYDVDVMPILHHLSGVGHIQITFRHDTAASVPYGDPNTRQWMQICHGLNDMFSALATGAPSDLITYLRCVNALRHIRIWTCESVLEITFQSETRREHDNDFATFYYRLHEDKTLHREPHSQSLLNLQRLMLKSAVKPLIFADILHSRASIVWDLDNHTVTQKVPSILQVCRGIRADGRMYSSNNHIVGKMVSTDMRADFGCFASLKAWTATGKRLGLFAKGDQADLILQFDFSPSAELDDIRIDALNLCKATLGKHCSVHIQADSQSSSFKIDGRDNNLGMQILFFLTELVEDYPGRRMLPCPKVFMDGNGRVCEAQFTNANGSVDTVNRGIDTFDKLSLEDTVYGIGKTYINRIEELSSFHPIVTDGDRYSLFGRTFSLATSLPAW